MSVLLLVALVYAVVIWNQDGEEIFWLNNHRRVMSFSEWLYYRGPATQISEEAAALLEKTPKGSLPFVDRIFIPHYHALKEREMSMSADLQSFGLTNFEFRSTWDRKQVIDRKQEVGDKFFTDGYNLEKGGTLRYGRGRRELLLWIPKNAAWEERAPVTENILSRIANGMEHITIYEEIIKRNYSAALIVEDDAVFVRDFPRRFTEAMLQVPPDFDIVFVGVCMGRHAPRTDDPMGRWVSERVFYARQHRCANGYVLSRRAAEKLLGPEGKANLIPIFRNIDCWLEQMMANVIPKVYWLEPPLIYEGSKAFIPDSGSTARVSNFQRITGLNKNFAEEAYPG